MYVNYSREIPRDFFNEAMLLKCMGQLRIHAGTCTQLKGVTFQFDHDGGPFEIGKDEGSGDISVVNCQVTINGIKPLFYTPLNSRDSYPLICELDSNQYYVFEGDGEFTEEFIQFVNSLPKAQTSTKPEWLFIAGMTTCYVYCDKRKEKNGDYKEICRLYHSPVKLEIMVKQTKGYEDVIALAKLEEEKLRRMAINKEPLQVSGSGQTIIPTM